MRRIRILMTLATTAALVFCGSAVAQIQSDPAMFPPAGYPHRTIREVPGVQVGPPSGLAARGTATVPRGYTSMSTTIGNIPIGTATIGNAADYGSQYWSPSTATFNLQEQINQVTGLSPYGQVPLPELPGIGSGVDAAVEELRDADAEPMLPPFGLPSTARNSAGVDSPLQGVLQGAAGAGIPRGERPLEPQFGSGLEIPFEEFESVEEFRAWLQQQLASPGGGIIGKAMAANGNAATANRDVQRTAQSAPATEWEDRPPIGYIGVGSNASLPLGSLNLGQDVAAESARLVSELNSYLRHSRVRQAPPWSNISENRPMPLPRSSLGRRGSLQRGDSVQSLYGTAGAAPGIQPPAPPREYWQNLGGYQPPGRSTEWP